LYRRAVFVSKQDCCYDAKQMTRPTQEDIYVEINTHIGGEPDPSWFEAVVQDVLSSEGVAAPYEVSVILTDEETVHSLNRQYRNVDSPTDVIAFYAEPQTASEREFVFPGDGVRRLGDIVISLPQTLEQAEEAGHSVKKELALLTIHGVLHLLGYDHEQPDDAPLMRDREALLLDQYRGRHYD